MRNPSPAPGITHGSNTERAEGQAAGVPGAAERDAIDQERAALGPMTEPVPAAGNPAPALPSDSSVAAQGRRTLSTAFVRVGPNGHLTVELRNRRVLVLRDVVMRRKGYCGVQVLGGPVGAQYCGGYAEVAAARPGGAPSTEEPDLARPNPVESPRSPAKRN